MATTTTTTTTTTIITFDYRQIIDNLCPDSFFTISENDYSTLVWSTNNTNSKPTEDEIISKNTDMINTFALDHLRMERDRLLNESDRYSLPDFPHANDTIKNSWLIYRQNLRDITTQNPTINLETGELSNITWPTPPS